MYSGLSSYCPNSFGRPALGWVLTKVGAIRESSWTYCLSAFAAAGITSTRALAKTKRLLGSLKGSDLMKVVLILIIILIKDIIVSYIRSPS